MGVQQKLKVSAIQNPSEQNGVLVARQLKESVEVGQRLRGDPGDSYVRVSELTQGGLWTLVNGVLVPTGINELGGGGTATTADSVQGDGSSGSPIQLVGDSASPGNTKLYGTNVSGTKGWYSQPSGVTGVTITDGTHTVANATQVSFSGATVGGSSPNATVAVSGGSANVTPDTHPSSPTIYNDEFEFGSSIDLTGARFSGAQAWAWVNQGTSTASVINGSLVILPQVSVNNSQRLVIMPVTGATWEYTFKLAVNNLVASAQAGGFFFYNSSSTKFTACAPFSAGTNSGSSLVQRWTNPTTLSSTVATNMIVPATCAQTAVGGSVTTNFLQCYMKAGFDGTNLYWSYSSDGLVYQKVYTETPAAFIGSCTHIALGGDNNGAGGGTTAVQAAFIYDWFRKTL